MNLLIRKAYGLRAPWRSLDRHTADAVRVHALIDQAVVELAMVQITGKRGAGKTHAVNRALRACDARVVEPLRLDRPRMHMGDIERALIRDLSDETPRMSGEARSHQVRRVLGTAAGRVVLLLDDSHLMHRATLRALKRLHEFAWMRRSPLLAVVLVGQADRIQEIPEVALRSDTATLGGLTAAEARDAVAAAVNADRERIDAEALGGDRPVDQGAQLARPAARR